MRVSLRACEVIFQRLCKGYLMCVAGDPTIEHTSSLLFLANTRAALWLCVAALYGDTHDSAPQRSQYDPWQLHTTISVALLSRLLAYHNLDRQRLYQYKVVVLVRTCCCVRGPQRSPIPSL